MECSLSLPDNALTRPHAKPGAHHPNQHPTTHIPPPTHPDGVLPVLAGAGRLGVGEVVCVVPNLVGGGEEDNISNAYVER